MVFNTFVLCREWNGLMFSFHDGFSKRKDEKRNGRKSTRIGKIRQETKIYEQEHKSDKHFGKKNQIKEMRTRFFF